MVKWPKSISQEWETINTDMSLILSGIKGSIEKQLEKRGNLVYPYGKEKFGVKEKLSKNICLLPPPNTVVSMKSNNLSKKVEESLWKKATAEERDGINLLQEDLKQRLSKLHRAENLRNNAKRRKKQEQTSTKIH